MSQNWYEIHIYLQWHTNRDLHTLYSRMSFRLTLSDLAKYSMTWRMARSLCYSWASCWNLYACIAVTFNWRGSLLMHDVYSNEQLFSVMCGPRMYRPTTLRPLLLFSSASRSLKHELFQLSAADVNCSSDMTGCWSHCVKPRTSSPQKLCDGCDPPTSPDTTP